MTLVLAGAKKTTLTCSLSYPLRSRAVVSRFKIPTNEGGLNDIIVINFVNGNFQMYNKILADPNTKETGFPFPHLSR